MRIGFIGAGKVGFSMGKYLAEHGQVVTGYYSHSDASAKEAANFTETRHYRDMKTLVEDSDVILLSVPDGAIASVWEQLRGLPIQNKIIGHFSGSLSSKIFSDISRLRAYGYSIHPLFAIHDKYESYKQLSNAFFVLEGHEDYLPFWQKLFADLGNAVQVIGQEEKIRYHAACSMASNLYVGLVSLCEKMFMDCGFSANDAHVALSPLVTGNTKNIVQTGCEHALTGPIERNDIGTVQAHLEQLNEEEKLVYQALAPQVIQVAERKNPDRDYSQMKGVLEA